MKHKFFLFVMLFTNGVWAKDKISGHDVLKDLLIKEVMSKVSYTEERMRITEEIIRGFTPKQILRGTKCEFSRSPIQIKSCMRSYNRKKPYDSSRRNKMIRKVIEYTLVVILNTKA